ncbi:hypothetical protein KL953_13705 [Mycolicibacterium goodii]|uniref:phage tail protein n=1 Tax=Mycolicibacterium goodii TaxID=134601 RepID=UPI001BDD9514|nr:hypothetical protein [Mycolicibacterium goodii]MBU8809937.1 hypothetical protein [Mycolicibacterium goodii]
MPSNSGDGGGVSGIRIEVDPQVLIRAGQSMSSLGKQLDMLMGALGPMLSSGIASGIDLAGLAMALEYGDLTQKFSDTLAGGANTLKAVGIKLQASGHNYANADAVSTIGGGGPTGSVDGEFEETTPVDARDSPSLSVVPPPPSWFLVASFLGPTAWPSGNPSMLRLTAAQWKNLASGFSALSEQVSASRTAVSTQKIPEASQIAQAHADLADGVADLADQATQIATTLETFADNVQDTQDAIRRLLDRVSSIDGIVDTVKGIFTGDALDIVKEVVEDIRTLLGNFQRQVKAVGGLLEALKEALNDTVTKFQKWADKNLRELLGDQVGGAISDIIKFQTDLTTGVLSGVINTVAGTVAFADLDTWKGLGETALAVVKDPSLIDDIGIAAGKEFLAWDQLTGDNPGRGIGEAGFNIAGLFVGGPLSKGGTVAKGVNKVRRAFDRADSPSVDLPGRHGLDGDLTTTGSRVPEVPEIRQGGIPDSVINPMPPNRIDAPSSPNGLEAPVRPPDPPGPTTNNPGGGARPSGGGDGPPPDSPQRPVGPTDPGPTHSDAAPPHTPSTPESSHSGSSSVGEPGIRGNSEPSYTPSPVDHSPQHAPEPATPAAQNDAPHTPAESNPKPTHESAASDAPASTHSPAQHTGGSTGADPTATRPDNDFTSTDHHRFAVDESRSSADQQAHRPAEQQPAHTPAAEHSANHDRNSVESNESREPAYSVAANNSQPAMAMMSPGVGGGPTSPMTPHAPGPVHGGGESHSPAAKSPAPDTTTRGPETRASHTGSPEPPRAQQPNAVGPVPGTTPSAPVHPSEHTASRSSTSSSSTVAPAEHQAAPESSQRQSVSDRGMSQSAQEQPRDSSQPDPQSRASDRFADREGSEFEYSPIIDENGHYVPGSLPSYEELRRLTRTEADTAHYWSGRDANGVGVGPDGSGIAERIADGANGTTLEMTLERNGIHPLPAWNRHDPESVRFWEDASAAYAENARGNVTAIVGSDLRPGNIWQTVEIPRLMENPNVTRIVQIDPDTGKSTELFSRVTGGDDPTLNGPVEPPSNHHADPRTPGQTERSHHPYNQPENLQGRTSDPTGRGGLRDNVSDDLDRGQGRQTQKPESLAQGSGDRGLADREPKQPDIGMRADLHHGWDDDNHQQRGDDRHDGDNNGPRENAIGPDGRYKISGHGDYNSGNGTVVVPEGTSVTVYGEHGSPITQSLGNLIESGGDTSRVYKKTYYAGEEMPNYTLLPPDEMNIVGTPHTVDRATTLSDLLHPNMGSVDFAACLGYWNHRVFDVHGIYHRDTYEYIEKYAWPEHEELCDDDW